MERTAEVQSAIIDSLVSLQDSVDTESAHEAADGLLVDFLRHLGFGRICDEYEKIGKWYA